MLTLRIMVLWRTISATEQKARMKSVKKYRWFAIIILCQVYQQKKNICGMKASTRSHQEPLLKWPSVQLHTPATVKPSHGSTQGLTIMCTEKNMKNKILKNKMRSRKVHSKSRYNQIKWNWIMLESPSNYNKKTH
jgi:hypothetical protein